VVNNDLTMNYHYNKTTDKTVADTVFSVGAPQYTNANDPYTYKWSETNNAMEVTAKGAIPTDLFVPTTNGTSKTGTNIKLAF
jgi:hypothetical protein